MTDGSEYLVVLYRAETDGAAPISPGHVAEALDRSPAAATEMLQRLESRGLVTYEPYEGATLTAEGREAAADLYDTYQTLTRFFRDVLDLETHDDEARQMAGTISPAVAERLSAVLLGGERSDAGSPSDLRTDAL